MADLSEQSSTCGGKSTCNLCWATFDSPSELQRHSLLECSSDYLASAASHENGNGNQQQSGSNAASPGPSFSSSPDANGSLETKENTDIEDELIEDEMEEDEELPLPRTDDSKLVHRCQLCPKTFTNYGSYRRHLRMHSCGHRYTCEVCGKQFFRRYLWLKHYEKIHNNTVMKMCRCTICDTWLKNPDTLKEHIRTKHRKRPAPAAPPAAPSTNTIVLDSTSLKDIISSQQFNQATSFAALSQPNALSICSPNPPQVTLTPTVQCDLCLQSFSSQSDLSIHVQDAHGKRLKIAEETSVIPLNAPTSVSPLGSSNASATGGVFVCDECQKTFINRSSYLRHKKMHTGVRPYTCNMCCMSFFRSESLTTHKRKHSPNDPYRCYVCSHIAPNKDELCAHFISTHSKQPEEFDSASVSKSKNSRGRPAKFKDAPDVTPTTLEPNLKCSLCSQTFPTSIEYSQHQCESAVVNTVSCKLCKANFVAENELHEHVLSHVDEAGFICHKCGCFFVNEEDRFDHQETEHMNDEEHFCCIYCDVAFSNSIQLQDHVKRDHLDMYIECALSSNGFTQVQKTIQDFKCDWCNVIFDSYKSCLDHFRKAHSVTTVQNSAAARPPVCKQCNRPLSSGPLSDGLCESCASEEWYRCNVCQMTGPQTVVQAHMKRAHMTKISGGTSAQETHQQLLQTALGTSQTDPLFTNLKKYIGDVFAPTGSISPSSSLKTANGEGDGRILRALFSMAKSPLEADSAGDEEDEGVKLNCEECGKVFTHLNSFKRHRRMHLGINKLTCPECNRDFYRKDQYRKHLATHASDDQLQQTAASPGNTKEMSASSSS